MQPSQHLQPAAPVHTNGQPLSALWIGPHGDCFVSCLPRTITLPTCHWIEPTYIGFGSVAKALHAIDHYSKTHNWPTV